jgi:hypothetical protein
MKGTFRAVSSSTPVLSLGHAQTEHNPGTLTCSKGLQQTSDYATLHRLAYLQFTNKKCYKRIFLLLFPCLVY